MAEVAFALGALHFRADHAMARVRFSCHSLLGDWPVEGWPTGARVVFVFAFKERLATASADEHPGVLGVVVLACKGRLGTCLAQDRVLLWSQALAPLLVCLRHVIAHGSQLSRAEPAARLLKAGRVADDITGG